MNDPPPLTPTHLGPGRSRPPHLRSTSRSPIRQRATDDLIANLSPRNTVEALRNPSGALKECLDASTTVEQAFAMKVAIAARSIEEWLHELSGWPWPSGAGSAGFELPVAKRRRLSRSDESPVRSGFAVVDRPTSVSGMYMGSLLASEVATFEARLDDIHREMEVLELEEIKTQVLHNHIMPLSRPGTPISDNRSIASLSAYAKMDDLTALITATIVQALPNLSKLIRLMNLWNIRLVVLRKTPHFLASLVDGEVALRSGWNVINVQLGEHLEVGEGRGPGEELYDATTSPRAPGRPTLSRKDSEVIKAVLERKVAKAGRDLDRMLDTLEGHEDTLPDAWIDRMDTLEKEYGAWVAACERTIREAEYGELFRRRLPPHGPPLVPVKPDFVGRHVEVSGSGPTSQSEVVQARPTTSSPIKSPVMAEPTKVAREMTSPSPVRNLAQQSTIRTVSSNRNGKSTPAIKIDLAAAEQFKRLSETKGNLWGNKRPGLGPFDGSRSEGSIRRLPPKPKPKPKNLSLGCHPSSPEEERGIPATPTGSLGDIGLDLPAISDGLEPDLPVTPCPRRASDASTTSTVIFSSRGSSADDFASEHPVVSSPDLPALPDLGRPPLPRLNGLDTPELPPSQGRKAIFQAKETVSPPSSPPCSPRSALRSSSRSVSVTFNDMPTVTEIPDEEVPRPKPPLESSFEMYEDDLASDMGSPAKPATPSRTIPDDQRLQQQISEILESVPAKIKLASTPPVASSSFNYLNPPDFAAPTAPGRKSSNRPDQVPRSYSSMSNLSASSRAATPSFTLAPAYGRTSRSSRYPKSGNQEIKLYHLSRSNGEAPIKLFIRCVGENGERVMVRVGGGWADLGEYLKEYASHHGRRSQTGAADADKVAVQDASLPRGSPSGRLAIGSSPPRRPNSAQDLRSSPVGIPALNIRKIRRPAATSVGSDDGASGRPALPRTPLAMPPLLTDSRSTSSSSNSGASAVAGAGGAKSETPPSGGTTTSARSRSDSRLSWTEEEASLGMAGPRGKKLDMTPESKAWVESVKERVRIASGERKVPDSSSMTLTALAAGPRAGPSSRSTSGAGGPAGLGALDHQGREAGSRLGELGKVGTTKRLFRKPG